MVYMMNTNDAIDNFVAVIQSREKRRGTEISGQYAYLAGYLQSLLKDTANQLPKKTQKRLVEEFILRALKLAQE